MSQTIGYAAFDARSPLAPWQFERRSPGLHDVSIRIRYCGICHSDLHTVRAEWRTTTYPIVPGHEIVGEVAAVGNGVTRFVPGDMVGVGCLVDSCRTCDACAEGLEQYCEAGAIATYGGKEKETGRQTQGGYSREIVVNEQFVLRMPRTLDAARAAPLLCAGITTYSPLRHWQVTSGMRVGVVGLGGLGHMAVKLARAMGAEVTLLTTSPNKIDDAHRLGAEHVLMSTDAVAVKQRKRTLDLILDTVGAPHKLTPALGLLVRDGTLVLLGGSPEPHPSPPVWALLNWRRRLAGSSIGGIAETQEMLDFCAQHNIAADIELIAADQVNEAYDRMLRGDVRYRFVIDAETIRL